MSSTTTRRLPAQWVRALRTTLRAYLTMWLWFWAVALTILVLVLLLVDRFATVEMSGAQHLRNGGVWFPFSIAIVMTAAHLPFLVSHGLTRRAYSCGVLFSSVLSSLLYAFSLSLVVVTERAVYGRLGWPHTAQTDNPDAVGIWEHGFGAMLLSYGLAVLAGHVCGLLVAVTYLRLGAWRGTLALPLTVGPVFLVLVGTGFIGGLPVPSWELSGPTVGLTVVALAVIAAAAGAFHLLVRDVPIPQKAG